MSFTVRADQSKDVLKSHVKITITGCDCKEGVTYCINGILQWTKGCVIEFDIEEGAYSMCLWCGKSDGTGGSSYTFSVSSFTTNEFTVYLPSLTGLCNCDGTKKMKK